jgi:hypothetical protein
MTAWNADAEDVFGKAEEAEKDDKLDSGLGASRLRCRRGYE